MSLIGSFKFYNNDLGLQIPFWEFIFISKNQKSLNKNQMISALKPASKSFVHCGFNSSNDPVFTVHFPL